MTSNSKSNRRVVVTGIGVLSPIGIGAHVFWDRISSQTSGISTIERLSYTALPHNVGGEIKDFNASTAKKQYLKKQRKSIKVMCREIQLGVASASEALNHSGLDPESIDHSRLGVDFGANQMFSPPDVLKDGCFACVDDGEFVFDNWGQTGMGGMEPLWLLKYLPNMPACHIGILADARGPNNSLTLAEASGNLALGEAYRVIERNSADIMIAGTTGTRLHAVKCIHAALWNELATSDSPPETWCRPFDADRSGQVASEGACSFILEEEEHAKSRNATIYGTILGAGSSCVHESDHRPAVRKALVNAIHAALRDANVTPSDIGHINAHGLGERQSDIHEAAAICDVFGDTGEQVPVTAMKSYFGNAGASCGTLELASSLLATNHGVIPATLNYATPDPQCRINVVHGEHQSTDNKLFLNINSTNIGQASALVVCGT